MIAVDTNLLVYAHRRDADWHAEARDAVKGLAEGRAPWAIPWPCVHEFLAVVTHPRIFDPPSTVEQALDQLDAWMASPSLSMIGEGPGYQRRLAEVVDASRATGPKIHDARIAALCLFHGVRTLWTADRDFSRFAGLTTENPLVG